MKLALTGAAIVVVLVLVLVVSTRIGKHFIEQRNPPVGQFVTLNGSLLHHVHVPAGRAADLPPIVFIHGASGNLRDPMMPLRPALEGRAELVFLDRPGHGWSERGPAENATPDGQAATIAALLDHLGIEDAVVVGHSFGGAVAAAFALEHPERTRGLVFLAAATHPWPGAGTAWYYGLTATPVIGPLFAETLALPGGLLRMRGGIDCVFAPNPAPPTYLRHAGIELLLRPASFRANAIDVEGLYRHVVQAQPRYGEIAVPTVVVTGDADTVVYEEIHSVGLARDIPDAELVWVRGLGHKPDWVAPDLVVAAIERAAGNAVDLRAATDSVEARIAGEGGRELAHCPHEPAPGHAGSLDARPIARSEDR